VTTAELASLFQAQISLFNLTSPKMRERLVMRWFCLPWWILGPLSWSVETFKKLNKCGIRLPGTVDVLTPALVNHMNLGFSYSSKKARDRLGYEPVFSVEEGIQRSLHVYYRMRYGQTA